MSLFTHFDDGDEDDDTATGGFGDDGVFDDEDGDDMDLSEDSEDLDIVGDDDDL